MTKNNKKNRRIPAIILAGILVVSLLLIFLFQAHRQKQDDMLAVTLAPIETTKGWGYEIFVDGKVFIKQEFLPTVSGERGFKSKEQALAVGNLAVKKIVSGKMPHISVEELKALKAL